MFLRPSSAFLLAAVLAASLPAFSQPVRYTVILEEAPVAELYPVRGGMQTAAANHQRRIETTQRQVRALLQARQIEVSSSSSVLLNALFVSATPEQADQIRSLPGVKGVVPQRRYRLHLNRAATLANAPAAWSALGGAGNAGTGMKIAVLDTGIDASHPAFQDPALSFPAGYPRCTPGDCDYTNGKVIVARSYVNYLAAGSDPANPAADSRPDDLSARDRLGHGTAVASAAAGVQNTGAVTFSGIAPKAWLGNYKIYGTPNLNDFTTDEVIIQAAQDALADGMDVLNMSSGGPAFTAALDTGAACGEPAGTPCDPVAWAFENLTKQGVVVVCSAGNSGYDGNYAPTLHSVSSPANAPGVLAVGALTNSHTFLPQVRVESAAAPAGLRAVTTSRGDSYLTVGATTAPVVDVSVFGSPYGCSSYPVGALAGTIALIQRGGTNCTFRTKALNAWDAGAVGVILYLADATSLDSLNWGGVSSIGVPTVLISLADGEALKSYLAANPGVQVTIDAAAIESVDISSPNNLTYYSSRGPATGTLELKPDLVTVGANLYLAVQKLDPTGDMYSSNAYGVADGTSFSSPIVAGAAALVRQRHPSWTVAQIKSALVNSSMSGVRFDEDGYSVDVQSTGAGKLDVGGAVSTTLTAAPSSVSFGGLSAVPASRSFTVTNHGTASVSLALTAAPSSTRTGATMTLDPASLTLAPGASGTVTVSLSGTLPSPGSYNGIIQVVGGGQSLRVPYLYLVSSGGVDNLIPLADGWDTGVGQLITGGIVAFRLIDPYGVPVANVPVNWSGNAQLRNPTATTDANGIAWSAAYAGTVAGSSFINAVAGGLRYTFQGYVRNLPSIAANGVLDGASFDRTRPIVPGSYISIYGSNLSDYSDLNGYPVLPLTIDAVHVTFDVPSVGISVPGRMVFVSPNQVNVQVPWELAGQTSVQVKVGVNYTDSNVVTVPVADASPGIFENAGVAAALDAETYKVISSSNPVERGKTALLYANGLGPVTDQPATGEPALASPLSYLKSPATVTIGGVDAPVSFAGLAPGFSALYQLNVTVPSSLAPGTHPVAITVNGVTSKASSISVK